jgi:hypothetical protein
MTLRIRMRRAARNTRMLLLTSLGAGLYTLGSWMQGKSAKSQRPDEPVEGTLYDMQRYLDLSMARHCLNYQIIKDDGEDYRRHYPSREEYDRQVGIPAPYIEGDEIDTDELSRICDELGHDPNAVVNAIKRNRHLAINYLRVRHWDYRTQAQDKQ